MIPYYKQETPYTCGAAAMRMALAGLGIRKTEKTVAKLLGTRPKTGTRHSAFPAAAEALKLAYIVARGADLADITRAQKNGYIIITCFVSKREGGHYAVVKRVAKNFIELLDPIDGSNHRIPIAEFTSAWHGTYSDREKAWFFGVKK